jgi:hypothetical protein
MTARFLTTIVPFVPPTIEGELQIKT